MTAPEYERSVTYSIWNNRTGERFEVGQDRDGLGMVELSSVSDDGKRSPISTLPFEAAALLHECLGDYLVDIRNGRTPGEAT